MPRHAVILMVAVACSALSPMPVRGVAAEEPEALPVRCLKVGRGEVSGELVAIAEGGLELRRAGARERWPLREFREIVFAGAEPPPADWALRVWLREGSLLNATRIGPGREGPMALEGEGWRASGLGLSSLRALAAAEWLRGASPQGREEFQRARREPPVGRDLLLAVDGDDRRRVRGIVDGLTEEGLAVLSGERRVELPWRRVGWLVLSPVDDAGTGGTDAPPHRLMLRDGGRVSASSLALAEGRARAGWGSATFTVRAERLRRVVVGSDAYRYLSDLQPVRVETAPFLDVVWPPRMDRAIAGGPLTLGERTYPKGIGMHTRTTMTFAPQGEFSTFYARVGVDRAAGGRGSVIFRVLVDGDAAFQSAALSGRDDPVEVEVDLAGADELTLVADFGSPVDASGNFADWAEARIVQ